MFNVCRFPRTSYLDFASPHILNLDNGVYVPDNWLEISRVVVLTTTQNQICFNIFILNPWVPNCGKLLPSQFRGSIKHTSSCLCLLASFRRPAADFQSTLPLRLCRLEGYAICYTAFLDIYSPLRHFINQLPYFISFAYIELNSKILPMVNLI